MGEPACSFEAGFKNELAARNDRVKLRFKQVLRNACKTFSTNGLLAYNGYMGFSIVTQIVKKLIGPNPRDAFDMEKVLSEKVLVGRVGWARVPLFLGGISGTFKFIRGCMKLWRDADDGWNDFVAGAIGALWVTILDKDRRRTLAMYGMARAVQGMYNASKARGWWHFWGSDWAHGDSLLFVLSSAQVMYAYVMRPETLPRSYYKFILNTGPIDELLLESVRRNCRGVAIDPAALNAFAAKASGGRLAQAVSGAFPLGISAQALHPRHATSLAATAATFVDGFKKALPM